MTIRTLALLACCLSSPLLPLGLSAVTPLSASESWQPGQHPAHIERTITAFTRPRAALTIAAEDQARLLDLPWEVGATITADASDSGDTNNDDNDKQVWVTIASLDDRLARHRLQAAEAALAESAARRQQVDAEIQRANRELQWWESEFQRSVTLAEAGRQSEQAREELRFRRDSAALTLESLRAQQSAAEASHQAASAQLAQQRQIVTRHQLQAPANWRVAQRWAEPGSLLSPGSPVLSVVDVSELELPLRLSTEEVAALRAMEQTNDGILLNHGEQQLSARLHGIDPRFDPATRKTLVLLRLDGSQLSDPRGGLEMTLTLHLPDPQGGLLIPLRFTQRDLDQWLVRSTDGTWIKVLPLRQEHNGIVVSPQALAQGQGLMLPDQADLP